MIPTTFDKYPAMHFREVENVKSLLTTEDGQKAIAVAYLSPVQTVLQDSVPSYISLDFNYEIVCLYT